MEIYLIIVQSLYNYTQFKLINSYNENVEFRKNKWKNWNLEKLKRNLGLNNRVYRAL